MRWMLRTNAGLLMGLLVFCCGVVMTAPAQAAGLPPKVIAVDQAATGANDGTSWADAYTDLQDALDFALSNPESVDEIWVAAGEYKPSEPYCPGCDPQDITERHNVFEIIEDVGIYGGFLGTAPGGGEDQRIQRNPETNLTTLSGDIGNLGDPADNCYHVVVADTIGGTAILSGFTITAGNADGTGRAGLGGGMHYWRAGPTVTRCSFTDNIGAQGGGVWLGINAPDPEPYFVNCLFAGNDAGMRGGGARMNGGGKAHWINCTFRDNEAGLGGGLSFTLGSEGTLTNCTVVANSAVVLGGGIQSFSGDQGQNSTVITNCIFWGNEDAGGMDESAQIDVVFAQFFTVTYTCIQGCDDFCDDPDDNNIDDFPEFGPGDSNYRLLDESPCLDAASDFDVPDDLADVDDNGNTGEQLPWDLDTRARIFDAILSTPNDVDMGAYEFQPCPWDVFPPEILPRDCVVSAQDLIVLLANWGECDDCNDCPWDFDGNCTVGASDLLALLVNWGPCACGEQTEPLSLEEELALHCLDLDDWDDFEDKMQTGTEAEKENYLCWMLHYLEDCSKCFCTGQSGCPGPDPYNG